MIHIKPLLPVDHMRTRRPPALMPAQVTVEPTYRLRSHEPVGQLSADPQRWPDRIRSLKMAFAVSLMCVQITHFCTCHVTLLGVRYYHRPAGVRSRS